MLLIQYPPELVIEREKEITIPKKSDFQLPLYKTMDKVNDNITDKKKVNSNLTLDAEGIYEIKFIFSDSSGNKSENTITIYIEGKNAYIKFINQRLNY